MVNKQKILIVDDDEAIAELVSLYLAKECFDTIQRYKLCNCLIVIHDQNLKIKFD